MIATVTPSERRNKNDRKIPSGTCSGGEKKSKRHETNTTHTTGKIQKKIADGGRGKTYAVVDMSHERERGRERVSTS